MIVSCSSRIDSCNTHIYVIVNKPTKFISFFLMDGEIQKALQDILVIASDIYEHPNSVELTDKFNSALLKCAQSQKHLAEKHRNEWADKCQKQRRALKDILADLEQSENGLPDILPPYEPLAAEYEKEFTKWHPIHDKRLKAAEFLYNLCVSCAQVLGEEPIPKYNNLSDRTLHNLEDQANELEMVVKAKTLEFTKALDDVFELVDTLEYTGPEVEKCQEYSENPQKYLAKPSHFTYLWEFLGALVKIKEERLVVFDKLLDRAKFLAQKLDIPIPDVFQGTKLTYKSLESCRAEIDRLNQENALRTKEQFNILRHQFEELSGFLGRSSQEIHSSLEQFACTDESIDRLRSETTKMEKQVRERKRILELITELESLEDEEKLLDEASKDPSRYSKRGAMIEEGKRRSRLAIRKPNVIRQLKKLLAGWPRSHNDEPYLHKGRNLLQELSQVEQRRHSSPRQPPKPISKNTAKRTHIKNPTTAAQARQPAARLTMVKPRLDSQLKRSHHAGDTHKENFPQYYETPCRPNRSFENSSKFQTPITPQASRAGPMKRSVSNPILTPALMDEGHDSVLDIEPEKYKQWRENAIAHLREAPR